MALAIDSPSDTMAIPVIKERIKRILAQIDVVEDTMETVDQNPIRSDDDHVCLWKKHIKLSDHKKILLAAKGVLDECCDALLDMMDDTTLDPKEREDKMREIVHLLGHPDDDIFRVISPTINVSATEVAIEENVVKAHTAYALRLAVRDRKQVLGELLFGKIQLLVPQMARKITGMLLELHQSDVVLLLFDERFRMRKILKALDVLKNYYAEQREQMNLAPLITMCN